MTNIRNNIENISLAYKLTAECSENPIQIVFNVRSKN